LFLQIEAGLLQKEYVAKVVGVFPDGEVCRLCSAHISPAPRINDYSVVKINSTENL
jgi:hypothetical protein